MRTGPDPEVRREISPKIAEAIIHVGAIPVCA